LSAKLPDNIRAMYADAYKLHETLYGMGVNTTEFWENCHCLMVETCAKHNDHPLMISLAVAVADQLERDGSDQNGS